MIKSLVALTLFISMNANALNWQPAAESELPPSLLMIDIDSVFGSKDKEDPKSPFYIGAIFKLASADGIDNFAIVMDSAQCALGKGIATKRVLIDSVWTSVAELGWNKSGETLDDMAPRILCNLLKRSRTKGNSYT